MMRGESSGSGRGILNGMLVAMLWLLAMPAFALGLGQIEVKSKPGQPLLAEIPIISTDPTELQGLTARLASPETFRRIGLEPPQGLVSGLRFEPALDASGKPVIRVTSVQPVNEAALVFLLEVDWGQGKLVREYTAMVDAPRSVAAPVQAPMQAPAAAQEGLIQRPPLASAPVEPAPGESPSAEAPQEQQEQAEAPIAPAPEAVAARPVQAPPPVPAPVPAPVAPAEPAPAPVADAAHTVQRGETLSEIAGDVPGAAGYSLDQTMLALLHANPEAFIGDDINRLRAGAVLRMPSADDLDRYSTSQAAGIVREQINSWRESRQAQVQAAAAATQPVADASRATNAAGASPTENAVAEPRVADARLEIAPPRSADAAQAGTQSGMSAGGEGEMLRQELQETKENLAARDAEVADLKARVAELEQLQQQQQDLISMKDSALANAQEKLQQAETGQPQTATTSTDMAASWWWLLPVALVAAGLIWWLRRRKPASEAKQNSARISDRYAAAVADDAAAGTRDESPAEDAATAKDESPETPPQWVGKSGAATIAAKAGPAQVSATPTWMSGEPKADAIASLNQAPAGRDRIELARAYVELGDRATARSLLQEVIDSGDPKAREEAEHALRAIG